MEQAVTERRTGQIQVVDIARVCHDANRAYCKVLGDDTQPPWEYAPAWQRDSAITGINAIVDNPSLTSEQSHENWMQWKLAEGWTYAPVKNPVTKTHPNLVSYSELSSEQQTKDALFGSIVRVLMPMLVWGVPPLEQTKGGLRSDPER